MYKFSFHYVKPKYSAKAQLSYIDADSFIIHLKTDDIYKDIAEDVGRKFDISNWIEQTTTDRKKQESYPCNERWVR